MINSRALESVTASSDFQTSKSSIERKV